MNGFVTESMRRIVTAHGIINMIYLRLPVENKELGIPNYKQIVTDYAKKNGVSVNGLLTALVERELGIEIIGLSQIRDNARARIREQIAK